MQNSAAKKAPWTKGERFILWAVLLTIGFAILGTVWGNRNSAMPRVTIPTPNMPMPNAFDTLVEASVMENGDVDGAIVTVPPSTPAPGAPMHLYTTSERINLVRGNAAALALLRQGLTQTYLSPPVRSFSQGMPYYSRFRRLARLLTLEAQARESQRNWSGAVQSGLDSLQMGTKLMRGAPLIGALVGIACEAIGRRSVWLEINHLNAPQARAAAARLQQIRQARISYASVMQEEKWVGEAGLMEAFRKPTWRAELRAMARANSDRGTTPRQWAQTFLISRQSLMDDYSEAMDRVIRNADRPYAVHPPAPPFSDLITQSLTDDFSAGRFKDTFSITEDSLLEVTLALHAYKAEHGTYPPALASLVPVDLTRIPQDPFALSAPLHYRRRGQAYVLYSIGPDGTDDGGRPVFDATRGAPRPGEHDNRYYVEADSRGDIVAGLNE